MSLQSKALKDEIYFEKKETKFDLWFHKFKRKPFIKNIRFWYQKFIWEPWYDFKYGIRNYIKWYKIIWKDRNWGDNGVYNILEHKLILLRDQLVKESYTTDIDFIERDMNLCINLIHKIKNEYYVMEHYDYYKTKWEFTPIPDDEYFYEEDNDYNYKEFSTLDIHVIWEKYDDYLKKYKSSVRYINKRDGVLPKDKQWLCHLVGEHNHERSKKILHKILLDKLDTFWQ